MRNTLPVVAAVLLTFGGTATAQELTIDAQISGDRARLVAIQTNLNAIGIDVGKPDGVFGRGSKAGLIRFIDQFRPGAAYVLDAEIEAVLARVAQSYTGDPWAEVSTYHGISARPVESMWDLSDQVALCAQRKCQTIPIVLAAGDLTGDGLDEIVYAVSITDADGEDINWPSPIVIMTPQGGGRYAPLEVKGDGPESIWRVHPRWGVIEDFNGDGLNDLFVAAHGWDFPPFPGEQNLLVLSSPEGPVDVSRTNIPLQDDFAHGAAAGDLDGDGDLDLIVITNLGATRIDNYVLWNDGTGRFTQAGLETILDESLALAMKRGVADRSKYVSAIVDDIDADGHLDLLLLASGDNPNDAANYPGLHYTRIVYGDGSGKWSRGNAVELPRPRWGFSTHGTDAAFVDIDGDGDRDIILGSAGINSRPGTAWRGNFLQVMRNDGRTFADVTADYMFPQGYENEQARFPRRMMSADLNEDGRLDLVVSSEVPWNACSSNEAWRVGLVAIAQDDGTYLPLDPRAVGVEECSGWNLAAVDADGDGDVDLVGGRSLGEVDAEGNFRSFGLKVETFLNDPDAPPPSKLKIRTDMGGEDFPGDTTRFAVSLRSQISDGDETTSISFNIQARVAGGRFSALRLALDDTLGDEPPQGLRECGFRTEVWDDNEHHLILQFRPVGGGYAVSNLDCALPLLPPEIASKITFLIDNFAAIARSIVAGPSSDHPVTNPLLLDLMQQIVNGDATLTR